MPTTRLRAGELVNQRYEITQALGYGGFAAVYEAEDKLIGRTVAVKVLNILAAAHDPERMANRIERFRREAQAAARVDHPNVVTVFDMGFTETMHQPFIVMERLYGHDLSRELKHNGPMAPGRIMPLFCRCLDGLAAGHKIGIVHKDLKPSNLFLNHPGEEDEDLRVVDFGIARQDDGNDPVTGTGEVFGTAKYMAPEYIKYQLVTPALDVYQMGLILAELLTGQPAVDDNAMNSLIQHSSGDLSVASELTSSPLGPVLARALELNPEHRYEDAAAFRAALEQINPLQMPTCFIGRKIARRHDISGSLRAQIEPDTDSQKLVDHAHQEGDTSQVLKNILEKVAAAGDPGLGVKTEQIRPRVIADGPPTTFDDGWERERRKANMTKVFMIVGICALVVSAVMVFVVTGDDGPPPSQGPADGVTSAPIPTEAAAPAAPVDPQVEYDFAPEDVGGPVEVELVVKPSSATIRANKRVLGRGKYVMIFENKDARPLRVSISAPGHKTQSVNLIPDDAPRRAITLPRLKGAHQSSRGGGGRRHDPTSIVD